MLDVRQLLQRGWQQHQSGDLGAAERHYREALKRAPDHPEALVYLGIALFDKRQFQASIEAYQRALAFRPQFPIAWNNLGNSHRMLGQIDEAEGCFAEALRQQPDYLSALKNRGTLWIWSGEIERGLRWYQEGLRIDPNDAELHRNLGVIHLLLGDYDVGWPEYRWRWRMPGMVRPHVAASPWRGESVEGRTILIYPEQGLGDTIHFARVASILQQWGARVMLRCSTRMLPLFTSLPGVDQLVLDTVAPPPTDFHASLIEVLDILYGQTGQMEWGSNLWKDGGGYLTVSEPLVEYWKCWLDQHTNTRSNGCKRIGINWQGNPQHHADVYRSIPLELLRPLSQLAGVELISLQFGFGSEQLQQCDFAERIVRLPEHVDRDGGAFTDTTAILHHLDCVITTDTAIAHLAGAVGTPVAMMLGRVPDWRWGMQGKSTPWYPSVTLYRQQQLGRWEDVVAKVGEDVTRWTAAL
jgi:Flp pilus assembly protein TadD